MVVRFPDVDWEGLQKVYGWAALQWQGWMRGEIFVHGDEGRMVVLWTEKVLEFWVDGVNYFGGDFYGFRRAPVVVWLEGGEHRVDVRVVRDVRAMGGMGEPNVQMMLEAKVSKGALEVVEGSVVVPDMAGPPRWLVSSLGSVGLRNEGAEWVNVVGIESVNDAFDLHMRYATPVKVAPGQSRPVAFDIAVSDASSIELAFRVLYKIDRSEKIDKTTLVQHGFHPRQPREPQKITYLHPGGIVSYGILRPPSEKAVIHTQAGDSIPVILALHGAGVETDSDMTAGDSQTWRLQSQRYHLGSRQHSGKGQELMLTDGL
ncbi:MAG: hypothetical protein Q9183_002750 [Haloplaca sp. 2 TL-2023]